MSPGTALEQPAKRVHLPWAATAILLTAAFTLLHAVAVGTHRGQTLDRELFMLSAGTDPTVVTLAATARTGILVLGGLVLAAGAVFALRAGRDLGRGVPDRGRDRPAGVQDLPTDPRRLELLR